MHYGLIAIGSRGDVQPFVALSLGLRARGHKVTLMAHENFADNGAYKATRDALQARLNGQ